jgi:hypothetical protein
MPASSHRVEGDALAAVVMNNSLVPSSSDCKNASRETKPDRISSDRRRCGEKGKCVPHRGISAPARQPSGSRPDAARECWERVIVKEILFYECRTEGCDLRQTQGEALGG